MEFMIQSIYENVLQIQKYINSNDNKTSEFFKRRAKEVLEILKSNKNYVKINIISDKCDIFKLYNKSIDILKIIKK